MNNEPLHFKDGKFKIMLLGDLHDRYDMKSENAVNKMDDTLSLISKGISELKPDLVVYMGDNAAAGSEYEMRSVISRITYPVAVNSIPFDLVFGNHDRECGIDLKTQLKLYREHENCYAYNADDSISGYGNHNLVIKSSDGKKDVFNLWFIDSNDLYEDRSVSYYDTVHSDQIEWYKKTAKELADKNSGKVVPSLVFQHIPVPEEYGLLREAKPYERLDAVQGHRSYSDKYYVLKQEIEGYLGEGPAVPDISGGEFDAWKETGDVLGAFFGHDHLNDFVGYVDGILLGQCKTAGFRVYTDGCRSGVRMITLDEENPENIQTKMYHFKDFGLKCKSLDPYKRNVTDRQDMKLKVLGAAVGATAALTAAAVAANKVLGKAKKEK